ncbi:MAG: flippase-like domain-containing protein [Bacteroidetes bacterium]|nr:flippase-like domain-containing protein [Bacteroidota bacterium]
MIQGPWYVKFWWLIKVLAFLVSCWFIYFHFNRQWVGLGDAWSSLDLFFKAEHNLWLITVFMLAILNWSIEAIKWKYLIKKIEIVSFFRAIRAVFNGITVSFFTPNRSGEFAGRIIYLHPDNRVKGALLSLLGSTSQLLLTFQAGLVALLFYLPLFLEMETQVLFFWRVLIVLIIVLLSIGWWKLPRLVKWIDAMNIRSAWKEKVHVWDLCSNGDLLYVWSLSLFRYVVFTLQQLLLFKILGFHPPVLEMAGLSALSFMLITAIPSIALGELGIRGSVNLAIFGFAGALSSSILLVTFSIWCINLAFPAMLGATSVLFLKVRNKVIL